MARGERAMTKAESKRAAASKRGRRGPGLRRLIATAAFLPLAGRAPLYARLLWSLIVDPRTPASRKALLAGALGYVVLGRDVVPDWVPILGQLDDLVVVALATEVFLDGLDDELLDEKLAQAGSPREAFDEDVARMRRLMPGPIRRTARRLPGMARTVGDAVAQSGVAPRVRGWIADRNAPA